MAKISVLGIGAMGSRMAANLLNAGHQVTVWNRTDEVTNELVSAGARSAITPREAVAEADFVLSMVRDNEASKTVWLDDKTGALAGMKKGALAIESSTLTPEWIKALAAEMELSGQPFIEAPVSGTRPQAATATLVWFVGGDAEQVERVQPLLMKMGAAIFHTGGHGSAALTKLATNALMGVQVAALAEIIGVLTREGADVARVLSAVAGTSSWSPLAGGMSTMMLGNNFAPQFPAELIEKDFNYILKSAPESNQAPTLNGARDVFRLAMENGIGGDNMSGVVRLFC